MYALNYMVCIEIERAQKNADGTFNRLCTCHARIIELIVISNKDVDILD